MSIIEITDSALEYLIKKREEEADKDSYFYLGLKGGGCSGFQINASFKSIIEEEDKQIDFKNLKIAVNKKSYLYLIGTKIDYVTGILGNHLDFQIPSATSKCGCGISISFK